MLYPLFEKIVEISAILAAAAVLYIAFRPLIRKYFSAAAEYALLAVILLRGLIPVNFALTLPAAPMPEPPEVITEIPQTELNIPSDMIVFLGKTPEYPKENFPLTEFPEPYVPEPAPQAVDFREILSFAAEILPWLWLAGIIAVLAVNAIRHIRTMRALKRNTETVYDREILEVFGQIKTALNVNKWIEIRRGRCIRTPMLCGFSRTVLYLPETDFSAEQLGTIFRHELTHFLRGDLWGKLFLMTVKAVHWFNPLVWLLSGMAEFSMELACDNEVLKEESPAFRRNYGYMILEVAVSGRKQDALTTKFYGGKKQMKKRFENIARQRSFHSGKALLIAGIMITLVLGLFIGCKREAPEDILPDNTAATAVGTTAPGETSAPDIESDIRPTELQQAASELSGKKKALHERVYYMDRMTGNIGFSGEITEIDGNSFTVYFAGKDWAEKFEYDDKTIMDVPGGLEAGQQVNVIAKQTMNNKLLAKTIWRQIPVTINGKEIIVAPPTNIAKITGEYRNTNGEEEGDNKGVDLTSSDGDNGFIFSSVSGTVIMSKWYTVYGNCIMITDGKYIYRYAHCSKLLVKQGDEVRAGQVIGLIGNTGNSVKPHLHFEVSENGKFIDPTPFLGEIPKKPSKRVNSTEIEFQDDIEKLNEYAEQFAKAYFSNDFNGVKAMMDSDSPLSPMTNGKDIWDSLTDTEIIADFIDRDTAVYQFWYRIKGETNKQCLEMKFVNADASWQVNYFSTFSRYDSSYEEAIDFDKENTIYDYTKSLEEISRTDVMPNSSAVDFAKAYFSDDLEALEAFFYPTMDLPFEPETYGENVWDTLENIGVRVTSVKDKPTQCRLRFNFPGEDSYTYLNIEMIRMTKDGNYRWYVVSYGLEK